MYRTLALALMLPAVAVAAPYTLQQQGRLLDAAGEPIDTVTSLTVRLYNGADEVVYTEAFGDVSIERGYYAVTLGAGGGLTNTVLSHDPLYVGLQVGTDAELPLRQQLSAVPYALHAGGVTLGEVTRCAADNAGTLSYSDGRLALCDGTGWQPIQLGRDGSLAAPALSCKQLHEDFPSLPSGPYHLLIDGESVPTYCEMSFGGGGWTRVAAIVGNVSVCSLAEAQGTPQGIIDGGAHAWLAASKVDTIPFDGEVLLYDSASNWTRFTSSHADWSWSRIANGTINPNNVTSYNISSWSDNMSGYVTASTGTGCLAGSGANAHCLLGVKEAGNTWSMILGIGAYSIGSYTQTGCQGNSGSYYGMYSGGSWGTDGEVYIR